MTNIIGLTSVLLGGLIGIVVIIKVFKPSKIRLLTLMLGVAAFFVSMFVQTPIQQLPFLFEGIKTVEDIIAQGIFITIIAAFYMGFVAGAVQEGIKYAFLKKDNINLGFYIGLGFGLAEVIYLLINGALTILIYGSTTVNISPILYVFTGVERFLVVIFHTVTAVFMTLYGINGLIIAIVSHGAIDSLAACIQFYSYVHGYDTFILWTTGILYVLIFVLDIAFLKSVENVRKSVTETT